MLKRNIQQITYGICVGFLVWLLFIIADFIDETYLDNGFFIGAYVYLIIPVLMVSGYIFYYFLCKPTKHKLFVWFCSYCLSFVFLWVIIFLLINNDLFIVQKYRGDGIYLNGMEYVFYGLPTIFIFGGLCLLFHFIVYLIKKIR